MLKLILLLCLIASSFIMRAETLEGSSDIVINGNILARTCDVAAADAKKYVDLQKHDRRAFPEAGNTSSITAFTIKLENCVVKPNEANNVYMTFSGQSASNNELLALNNAGSNGVAGGIAIELLDDSSQRIALNSEKTYPITTGDNLYTFGLRYYAETVPITAGDASAVLYIDLRYE